MLKSTCKSENELCAVASLRPGLRILAQHVVVLTGHPMSPIMSSSYVEAEFASWGSRGGGRQNLRRRRPLRSSSSGDRSSLNFG